MMVLLLCLQTAFAEDIVFVLQTLEQFDSSSGQGDVISEKIRSGTVEMSAQAGISVLSKEEAEILFKQSEALYSCKTSSCFDEMYAVTKADYLLSSSVYTAEGLFYLNVNLHSKEGKSILSSMNSSGMQLKDLIDVAPSFSRRAIRAGFNIGQEVKNPEGMEGYLEDLRIKREEAMALEKSLADALEGEKDTLRQQAHQDWNQILELRSDEEVFKAAAQKFVERYSGLEILWAGQLEQVDIAQLQEAKRALTEVELKNSPEAQLQRLQELLKNKSYDDAIDLGTGLSNVDLPNAQAPLLHLYVGQAYQQSTDCDKALIHFQTAIDYNPKGDAVLEAMLGQAQCLAYQGNSMAADVFYKQILRKSPPEHIKNQIPQK